MIDPTKLTAENGFVDGVVVEIVWDNRNRRHQYTELCMSQWDDWEFEQIESIRPLTGPMAIWNFAPEWATHLTAIILGDEVAYPCWHEHGSNTIPDGAVEIERPFWAVKE